MHVNKCLVSNLQYQSTKRCFKGTIIQIWKKYTISYKQLYIHYDIFYFKAQNYAIFEE